MNNSKPSNRLSSNKKANQKYEKIECFEAGIKLTGSEVKSTKHNHTTIDGAYVVIRGGEAFAIGVNIPAWQPNNNNDKISHQVDRNKKLLLSKKQLFDLSQYDKKKGFAIPVFSLYNKKGLIKAEICVAKTKSTRDKRQEIKKRDIDRDLRRSLKN